MMLNMMINDDQVVWTQWNGLTHNCHDQPQSALHDGEKINRQPGTFLNSSLLVGEDGGTLISSGTTTA